MSDAFIFDDDCKCPAADKPSRRDLLQTKFWVLDVFVDRPMPTAAVRLTGGRVNQLLRQARGRCKGCVARVMTELEKEGKLLREAPPERGKSSTWRITEIGAYCHQCMSGNGFS